MIEPLLSDSDFSSVTGVTQNPDEFFFAVSGYWLAREFREKVMDNIRIMPSRGCCFVLVVVPFLIVLINCGILPLINPIRRPESMINESLLKQTPIGTPRDEVKLFIWKQGWPMGVIYRRTTIGGEMTREEREGNERWLDTKLGSYVDFPDFIEDVYAEWHFDRDGKLESIRVWKNWANCP